MHELIIKFAYFVLFLAGLLFCNQQHLKADDKALLKDEYGVPSYIVAQQGQQISELEYEIRQLTGRLQTMEHHLRKIQDYMSLFVEKTENRLFSMEDLASKNDFNSSQKTTKLTSSQIKNYENSIVNENELTSIHSDQASMSIKQQYEYARSFLLSSDYAAAEKALQKFIEMNGSHALAGNALYWLGETYYVRNIYDDAIKTFATGYRTFPKGVKAADSLLKLSMSFNALNQKAKACDTINQLLTEFSGANQSIISHANKAKVNYNCR